MGTIIVFNYPVTLTLEHNDTPITTHEDEWGTRDVYLIEAVYWQNVTGYSWIAKVAHPSTGLPLERTIAPLESGNIALAVPARFNSFPFTVNCSLVRG